jgi:hypothetical protein
MKTQYLVPLALICACTFDDDALSDDPDALAATVTKVFQNGVAPTSIYAGMIDTYILQSAIKSIRVYGATSSRTVDYYEVVSQGSTPRNTQTQSGLHLGATAPAGGMYSVEVTPDPAYTPRRIVIRDFTGAIIVDKTL